MNSGSHNGWPQRLVWSCVLGTAAVVFSPLRFFLLASGHPSKTVAAASYVVAIPLLPGVGAVSVFLGILAGISRGPDCIRSADQHHRGFGDYFRDPGACVRYRVSQTGCSHYLESQ